MKPRLSPPVLVALTFCGVILILAGISFVVRQLQSPEESCSKMCSANGKVGQMVGKYPKHMLPYSKNPQVCECK
jgi:hypothetical protein